MKDNFSAQADDYSKYRPQYPQEMIDYIMSFVAKRDCALDVATGNGQLAAAIAPYFTTVYAIDISDKQLDNTIHKDNIIYKKQSAENTGFAPHQFDLITVAQAVHWFDFDAFYKEVFRILKKQGIIVIIGYGLFKSNKNTEAIINYFYNDVIGKYWDPERRYLEENYKTIPFPFQEVYTDKKFMNTYEWDFEQLAGYLSTWSAVQHYKKQNGKNPLDQIREDLRESWAKSDKKVTFPLLLRIGKLNN